ncbi:apolipoprotein C-I [Pyxicephalus adspersus]|uniref:apolipoprotein C-I n=1 Tax=Pyxicephalus adspersus TaxID=30357 RepID=UPI003B5A4209
MKLILAISVVIIALSVLPGPSSVQAEESSAKEKFDSFAESVKGVVNKGVEKIKNAYEGVRDSEFGTKTRNWFTDVGRKIKEKFTKK